eukprot:2015739-Pyramimonas_sp.AAC.1
MRDASPTAQSDGDHSPQDSPDLEGDDDITAIIMTLKEVSCLQFEYPRSSSALRHEKDFFYHLRGLQSRAHDAQDNTLLMK